MATRTWTGTTSGDWSVSTNWAEGSVPANGDDVYVQNNAVDISAGLDQHLVTLNSLIVDQTYTGKIGTTSAYLQISATTSIIGNPSLGTTTSSNTGSGRIKINFGSNQATVIVANTSTTPTETGLPPVRLLGTHASNTCAVQGGNVGWAVAPGETSTLATVNVGGGVLTLGSGCTLTTINQSGGALTLNSACTTINQSGGSLTTKGTGAITTINAGGTANLNSTGTITNLNVASNGNVSLAGDPRAKTVTNCSVYPGGTLNANNGAMNGGSISITFTAGIKLPECRISDVTLDLGNNLTLSVA